MTRPGEELPSDVEIMLGRNYNHRREPRVRLRRGRTGCFITLGERMTKRAAFRAARELRDAGGEKRPQVVWRVGKHAWRFGCRRLHPESSVIRSSPGDDQP
jgi:hypothetical protein